MIFEGRKAEVLFETGYHFILEYLKDNKMKYTSLMEENKGKTETVDIFFKELINGLYSISWIESTGTSVTHIINLNKGTIYAFMNWPHEGLYGSREAMDHKGSYKFIDDKSGCDMTNREVVTSFWEEFFNNKNIKAADKYICDSEYIQHNPNVKDGKNNFKDTFSNLFKNEYKDAIFKIIHIVEDGDLVGIHNHVILKDGEAGFAAFDLFRVVSGRIVEHWDVLQEIPSNSTNKRGMF